MAALRLCCEEEALKNEITEAMRRIEHLAFSVSSLHLHMKKVVVVLEEREEEVERLSRRIREKDAEIEKEKGENNQLRRVFSRATGESMGGGHG